MRFIATVLFSLAFVVSSTSFKKHGPGWPTLTTSCTTCDVTQPVVFTGINYPNREVFVRTIINGLSHAGTSLGFPDKRGNISFTRSLDPGDSYFETYYFKAGNMQIVNWVSLTAQ